MISERTVKGLKQYHVLVAQDLLYKVQIDDFLTGNQMTGFSEQAVRMPLDALSSLENGEKAVLAGETEKGIEIYQSILEIYPENKVARERVRELGVRPSLKPPKLYRKRSAPAEKIKSLVAVADSGNSLGALSGLNELVMQFPRDSFLYFLIGNIQRELGRISASVESYETSVHFLSTPVSSRIAVSARVVWHPVVFPKRIAVTGERQFHLGKWFRSVLIRFDFHVSHPAQPVIHSFSSPVSVFMKEAAVTLE